MGRHKTSARWVPKILTPKQKHERVTYSEDNVALLNCIPKRYLDHFVTLDETCVHHFNPDSKLQSMEWQIGDISNYHHLTNPPPLHKFRVQTPNLDIQH